MQYYGTRSTTGILGLRYTESSVGLKSGMKRNTMAVDRGCMDGGGTIIQPTVPTTVVVGTLVILIVLARSLSTTTAVLLVVCSRTYTELYTAVAGEYRYYYSTCRVLPLLYM